MYYSVIGTIYCLLFNIKINNVPITLHNAWKTNNNQSSIKGQIKGKRQNLMNKNSIRMFIYRISYMILHTWSYDIDTWKYNNRQGYNSGKKAFLVLSIYHLAIVEQSLTQCHIGYGCYYCCYCYCTLLYTIYTLY